MPVQMKVPSFPFVAPVLRPVPACAVAEARDGDLTSAGSWDALWDGRGSGRLLRSLRERLGWSRQIDETLTRLVASAGTGRPRIDILELGCAPGTVIERLHRLCPQHRYAGIDLAPEGLEQARHRLAELGIEADLHLGDLREIELPGADLVISYGLIEHFEDPAAILGHHRRLARPGGHVAVTVPNYANPMVAALLARYSPDTLATHNLEIMNEQAIADAMTRAGLVDVSVGSAVGPLLPSSRAKPGLGGSTYRLAARAWNLGAGILPQGLLWSGLVWGFGRAP